jgi:hypothetical protein
MGNQAITVEVHGGFEKTNKFLERCLNVVKLGNLDKYGRRGVEALRAATPRDTGLAASSWSYEIHRTKDTVTLEWHNDDIENGFPVVIGIQYGHATKSGSWVEGVDFINPALRPLFEEIKEDVLKEVKKH